MRVQDAWKFLIIPRNVLQNYIAAGQLGAQQGDHFVVSTTYFHVGPKAGRVFASKILNWTHHLNDWAAWPIV